MKRVKTDKKADKIRAKKIRKIKILSNKLNPILKRHIKSLQPKKVKKVKKRQSIRKIRAEKVEKEMERRAKFDAYLAKFDERVSNK